MRFRGSRLLAVAAFAAAAALGVACADPAEKGTSLSLTSPAFGAGEGMPVRFTCEGDNVSPPLAWNGAPAGTRSFALIVDDPDAPDPAAPRLTAVHWVVYDLPASASGLPAGASSAELPPGAREAINDFGVTRYGGPCPPIGRHRYFHKLYALDVLLGDLGVVEKDGVERAIEGHILARAELIGTYEMEG